MKIAVKGSKLFKMAMIGLKYSIRKWKLRKRPLDINWYLFESENLPEITGELSLDGSGKITAGNMTLTGKKISLPESGATNLYQYFVSPPSKAQRTYLIGEFDSAEAGEILAGFGAEWNWKFFFNGKLILDAMSTGNQQMPFAETNHQVLLDCRKGKNQFLFELYGVGFRPHALGCGMEMAFAVFETPEKLFLRYRPLISFPDASNGAVSVIFAGSRKSAAAVDYRKVGESKWLRVYDNLGGQINITKVFHQIRLEDLEADTEYEYKAVLIDHYRSMREEICDEVKTFRTAPTGEKEFNFSFTADLQWIGYRQKFMEGVLGENYPAKMDFCVFGGDLLWTSDFDRQFMDQFIEPYLTLTGSKLPLVMVRGNHEIYGNESFRYFEGFSAPYPGRDGYYLFRWGEVCFIVLDFCDDAPRMEPPSTRYLHDFEPYIAAEARWLKEAVRSECCQSAKYRIVLAHGAPLGDTQQYMPSHAWQVLDPVFSGSDPAVKIHLYLGGHVHRPFRSVPLKNECFCLNDPASLPQGKFNRCGEKYAFPVVLVGGPTDSTPENMCYTSLNINVASDKLTVRAFDYFQKEFDRFTITPEGKIENEYNREDFKYYSY